MTAVTTAAPNRAYVTVAEVAQRLRCSEPTIRRRIRAGDLPAVKLGHGRNSPVRVPAAGLDAWLRSVPAKGPAAA
jgi:excisionase family DNA binding protein